MSIYRFGNSVRLIFSKPCVNQAHNWNVNDAQALISFNIHNCLQRTLCRTEHSHWTREFVLDKYFTSIGNLLSHIEKRMGSVTTGLILMQPNGLGDQFFNYVLRALNEPGGPSKQKRALRKWIFRQPIRFDRVRLPLDNFILYFSQTDFDSLSEGIIDTKVYTDRGFNPKICHYSSHHIVKTFWTKRHLRVGIQ